MKLTPAQSDHYAKMRYHCQQEEAKLIGKAIADSPYGKNHRHIQRHRRSGDENYAACKTCVKMADAGYYVPVLNPEGW
jgi:hypothetical protein